MSESRLLSSAGRHLACLILIMSQGCNTVDNGRAAMAMTSKPPEPVRIREMGRWSFPPELEGLVYQARIVPKENAAVLFATDRQVWLWDEKPRVLFTLDRHASMGETAIFPALGKIGSLDTMCVGVLVHKLHAIEKFRLVGLDGKLLVEIDDPRHSHYRLAPDSSSFVGIDTGGSHTALSAKRLTYRFFNRNGKIVGEVPSADPQSPDSRYSPDGTAFLINSRTQGLSAYDTNAVERLWTIPKEIKFFAAANRRSGRVLISHATQRHVAELYANGKQQWHLDVHQFGHAGNVRDLAISPSGAYSAVAAPSVVVLLVAEHSSPLGVFPIDARYVINSVAMSDLGFLAVGAQDVGAGKTKTASGKIIVFDRGGNVVLAKNTEHRRTNAWVPEVQFDQTGRLLLVQTLEGIELFALEPGQDERY